MNDKLRDEISKLSFKDRLQLVRDYRDMLKENYIADCSLKQLVDSYNTTSNNLELLEFMKNIAMDTANVS